MRVYFSGGSPIPETSLTKPDVMLSFWVDAKNGNPNKRMRVIMKLRKKQIKKQGRDRVRDN